MNNTQKLQMISEINDYLLENGMVAQDIGVDIPLDEAPVVLLVAILDDISEERARKAWK